MPKTHLRTATKTQQGINLCAPNRISGWEQIGIPHAEILGHEDPAPDD